MPSIPVLTLLKFGIPAVIVIIASIWATNTLIGIGEARVQAEWDQAKIDHREEVEDLRHEIKLRKIVHRDAVRGLNNRLAEASRRYSTDLATIRASFDFRLRESEDRAGVYQRLSESGAVGRANLASYAAQLDRSLVEGRQVVGELRATVVQRDEQLRAAGEQLRADRELVNTPSE